MKTKDIAEIFRISPRQVSTVIRESKRCQTNKFTREEEEKIIQLYREGITKEFDIAKLIPSKAPWMIRNRIKMLLRKGLLQKYPFECFVQEINNVNPPIDDVIHPVEDYNFTDDNISQVDSCIPITIDYNFIDQNIAQIDVESSYLEDALYSSCDLDENI